MTEINRTTTATIDIVCPTWCNLSAEHHVAELGDIEGKLIHRSDDRVVEDRTAGPGVGYWDAEQYGTRIPGETVTVHYSAETNLAGAEISTPTFWVEGGSNLSITQAVELAEQLTRAVYEYRNWVASSACARGFDPGPSLALATKEYAPAAETETQA